MVRRHLQCARGGAGRLQPELSQLGWNLVPFSRLMRRTRRYRPECADFARLQPCRRRTDPTEAVERLSTSTILGSYVRSMAHSRPAIPEGPRAFRSCRAHPNADPVIGKSK